MGKIIVELDIHAYAEERLCDALFDDPPFYGIVGPDVMKPLSEYRNCNFEYEYNENTLVKELINFTIKKIWGNSDFCLWDVTFAFLSDNERYYIENDDLSLPYLIENYLDPHNFGEITLSILVSHNAGDVGFEYPLRFYVNSNESGRHHEAHIHVCDTGHQYEASIRILDGEIIAGKLPSKLAKLAKEKILSDQKYFYECWNTKTNGLQVDINKHFGLIQY